jgi:hypothetical protein
MRVSSARPRFDNSEVLLFVESATVTHEEKAPQVKRMIHRHLIDVIPVTETANMLAV